MSVEIISISRDTRTVTVRHRPQSQRELIDAILTYWKERELPFSVTEVLRYTKPQKVFYSVLWVEDD